MNTGKIFLVLIVVIVLAWFAMSLVRTAQRGTFVTTQVASIAEPVTAPVSTESVKENTMESYTTASGLTITVNVQGTGDEAKNGSTVTVHYTGTLADGTVFDSSVARGTPFSFLLGAGHVIQGWEEGVLGMKVGEKRTLVIPYTLAYGENGYGPIPPKAELTFEVELLEVK